MGGANAHVVLEEAPGTEPGSESRRYQMVMLSGFTETALESMTDNLVKHLREHPEVGLADVSYTLQVGRASFGHRRLLVCSEVEEAVKALGERDPERVYTMHQSSQEQLQQEPGVVFMFPGVGDHYVGMGRELYESEGVFRQWVDRCAVLLQPHLGRDVRTVLFPARAVSAAGVGGEQGGSGAKGKVDMRQMLGRQPRQQQQQSRDGGEEALQGTEMAQPAVFVIEYALAQLLMSWGIQPKAMIGYSLGEYVAACVAGVMKLEDALRVVAKRAQMIQRVEEGAMLTVALGEAEARAWVSGEVGVSAVLTPKVSVLGGTVAGIEEVEKQLAKRGIACRRLPTRHAFHSPMMQKLEKEWSKEMEGVELKAPQIPYLSNVSGDWITAVEATEAGYWSKHLSQTVRFSSGLSKLLKQGNQILLEVGPGRSLGSFAQQHPDGNAGESWRVMATMRYAYEDQSDSALLQKTVGKLWLAGKEISWEKYYAGQRRLRVPLPTYPFERERYWLERRSNAAMLPPAAERFTGKKPDSGDWFYYPAWKQTPLRKMPDSDAFSDSGAWLLFLDNEGYGAEIARQLKAGGQQVFCVEPGSQWEECGQDTYRINPSQATDYRALLKALPSAPTHIIHLWGVDQIPAGVPAERFFQAQRLGFYSFIYLVNALGQYFRDFILWCVTSNAQVLSGAEATSPEKSPVLGLCRVISQENPNITCRCIDLDLAPANNLQKEWQIEQLIAEFMPCQESAKRGISQILYRGMGRWEKVYEPAPLEAPTRQVLRTGGVYLITGGLGAIGMVLAKHLAESVQARLILTGRSDFPPRAAWDEWLSGHADDDSISEKIRAFKDWESKGSEVRVIAADAADESQMRVAVEQFGTLHGVIHAAGIVNGEFFRPIRQISKEQCEAHFTAKGYGLYVLEKVLAGRELDFCLLFSSLSSVLGGLGLGAYAAANLFMDTFVTAHNCSHKQWWTVVNWDTWRTRDDPHGRMGSTVAEFEMSPAEALCAFERVLFHSRTGQLVNSTGDLESRLDQWVRLLASYKGVPGTVHKRPEIMGVYVAPSNDIEERVAEVWQQFLGIAPIGIHDNFFELGGQSLLVVQIVSRFREIFQIELPLTAFFEAPTISELGPVINGIATEKTLEMIEDLSEEEVQQLLKGDSLIPARETPARN